MNQDSILDKICIRVENNSSGNAASRFETENNPADFAVVLVKEEFEATSEESMHDRVFSTIETNHQLQTTCTSEVETLDSSPLQEVLHSRSASDNGKELESTSSQKYMDDEAFPTDEVIYQPQTPLSGTDTESQAPSSLQRKVVFHPSTVFNDEGDSCESPTIKQETLGIKLETGAEDASYLRGVYPHSCVSYSKVHDNMVTVELVTKQERSNEEIYQTEIKFQDPSSSQQDAFPHSISVSNSELSSVPCTVKQEKFNEMDAHVEVSLNSSQEKVSPHSRGMHSVSDDCKACTKNFDSKMKVRSVKFDERMKIRSLVSRSLQKKGINHSNSESNGKLESVSLTHPLQEGRISSNKLAPRRMKCGNSAKKTSLSIPMPKDNVKSEPQFSVICKPDSKYSHGNFSFNLTSNESGTNNLFMIVPPDGIVPVTADNVTSFVPEISIPKDEWLTCSRCSNKYQHRHSTQKILIERSDEPPNTCKHCSARLKRANYLYSHMDKITCFQRNRFSGGPYLKKPKK